MATHSEDVAFLPDRLNAEPPIFLGLTNSEMFLLLRAGLIVWIPLGMLVASLFGEIILGFGAGCVLTMATVASGGKYLQKLKRGRPEGFYERYLRIRLEDKWPAIKSGFTRYAGAWDIRRVGL